MINRICKIPEVCFSMKLKLKDRGNVWWVIILQEYILYHIKVEITITERNISC